MGEIEELTHLTVHRQNADDELKEVELDDNT